MSLHDIGAMLPEIIIVIASLVLLLLDLFIKNKSTKGLLWVGFAGIILSILALLFQWNSDSVSILDNTYRLDAFSKIFKLIILVGGAVVYLILLESKQDHMKIAGAESGYLMLTALLGAMFLASSADLITLFVGLELLSLSSYIMVGLNKSHSKSNEGAFKYLVIGGISSAITLFGMSYLYGLTGETNLYKISSAMNSSVVTSHSGLVILTFIILFVGISFKIDVVPFQMWLPDVFQGAPTAVTAFLSVISKTAGFALLLRLFIIGFIGTYITPGDGGASVFLFKAAEPYLVLIAILTMVIGNTAALKQKNIKRLFAYSSIAQAGYLLLPFISFSDLTFDNTLFYLIVYLFMNLGAFAVIQIVTQQQGSEEIKSFRGLYQKKPWLAVAMTVFLVSLAGIPATAGFVGKFNIFFEAIYYKHLFLASAMIATTVVSYFYYFFILDEMFFKKASSEKVVWKVPGPAVLVLALCTIGTLVLGIFPNVAMTFLHSIDFNTFFTVKF